MTSRSDTWQKHKGNTPNGSYGGTHASVHKVGSACWTTCHSCYVYISHHTVPRGRHLLSQHSTYHLSSHSTPSQLTPCMSIPSSSIANIEIELSANGVLKSISTVRYLCEKIIEAMASNQEKVEKANEAGSAAAAELREIRQRDREVGAKMEAEQQQQQPQKSGVIGTIQEGTKSILKAVQGTFEHAKEAAVGKSNETAEKARETKESAAEKESETKESGAEKARQTKDAAAEKKESISQRARETTESAAEKARETTESVGDTTAEKTKETKDSAGGKAAEYKDYGAGKAKQAKDTTAEKAKEGKDTTVGKISELKDSAADAARKAMAYVTGKKEETKQNTSSETGEAAKMGQWLCGNTKIFRATMLQEKLSETEEATRQKMEEMRLKGEGCKAEAAEKSRETDDATADKGSAAEGGIMGTLGSVTETIKEKLTHPMSGVGGAARDEREKGGAGRTVAVIKAEVTPAGEVAAKLKAADQLSGQTFNDEGIARVDLQGKM